MSNSGEKVIRKCTTELAAIDQMLLAAIKQGSAKKRAAITRILELVPGWSRGQCWQRIRYLQKTTELAADAERKSRKTTRSGISVAARRWASAPWTPADDDRLLNLAGYEPVKKIAQRLGRSVRAVRFRLGALGMSAKVTDGWSLRALRKMLHVSPVRLRYLIGNGMLRVRDPRISPSSLAVFCDKNRASLEPSVRDRVAAALLKGEDGYMWERAADLIGATVAQVQSWICAGQLRVVDTFVTDRAFEEFCKKHGDQINMMLINPATTKWLVSEYGVSQSVTDGATVSGVQKHALVTRACQCGRKIAGNAYFRHSRICQTTTTTNLQDAR
ncbi:MAG TPA: hypothetical protein VII95_00315 [Terriglobales bacterium]